MHYFEQKLRDSVDEKRKYHTKVASLSAMGLTFDRVIDVEPLFEQKTWVYVSLFTSMDLSSVLTFAIHPWETEPLNFDFIVEWPTVVEWLRGIKFKPVKIDVGRDYSQFTQETYEEIIPPILDYDKFVDDNVRPPHDTDLRRQYRIKAKFDRTRFGRSYYDPPLIRDLMRSAVHEYWRRQLDPRALREYLKTYVERLGIAEHTVETIFNRIVALTNALTQSFCLGFGILGVSRLSERQAEFAVVSTVTHRGEVVELRYGKLSDLHVGFILGLTPFGFALLMPRIFVYCGEEKRPPWWGTPRFTRYTDWKARKALARYRATPSAVTQFQRIEEMVDWHKSDRAEQYHELRVINYYVEQMVESWLRPYALDAVTLNMYKRAAMTLVGHRKKRRRWGYDIYKAMTDEQYRDYWIDHWTKLGLDRSLLELIYDRIKGLLPRLVERTLDLGQRLKKIRTMAWR